MGQVDWNEYIRVSSGRDYQAEAFHNALDVAEMYPDMADAQLQYLNDEAHLYKKGGQNVELEQSRSTREDSLSTHFESKRKITPKDYIEAGENYLEDLDGDWTNLGNSLDRGYAYLFQTNNNRTLLGRNTNANKWQADALTHRHKDFEHEWLAPTDAAIDNAKTWAEMSGSTIGEAMKDLFYRSWSSEDMMVMFQYEQPAISLTLLKDQTWTEEKKKKAWEALNTDSVYGPRMQMQGMTEEDVMNTNNVDHLFFKLNTRYEQAFASQIIAADSNNWALDSYLTLWKRFAVDNFINDPDTAVELTAAAGTLALGFVSAGGTWMGTAFFAGRLGAKFGKGLVKSSKAHKAMALIRQTKTGVTGLHKVLPTQIAGGLVMPTMQTMKTGEKLWPALRWAYANPSPLSFGKLTVGSFIEGGMAGFGAYFTNTSAIIDIHDQAYGKGNHGVDWDAMDLLHYTGLGAIAGAGVGTVIRGSMAAGNKFVTKPLFNSALNKLHKSENGAWLVNLNAKRKDFLIDWALAEVGTPAISRATLEADSSFAKHLQTAESEGYDFATHIRKAYLDKKSRGLGEEDVKLFIERDIRDWRKSRDSKLAEVTKGLTSTAQDEVVRDGETVAMQKVQLTINGRLVGKSDATTLDTDGGHVSRAQQNAEGVKRYHASRRDVVEAEDRLAVARDKGNPSEVAKIEEEIKRLMDVRDKNRTELNDASDTWLLDEIQSNRSTRISQRMGAYRQAINHAAGNELTAPVMRHLIGEEDLGWSPEVSNRLNDMAKQDQALTRKEALDMIDEVEGNIRTNRYEVEDGDIMEYTVGSMVLMGDELIKSMDALRIVEQVRKAELGDPKEFELQERTHEVILTEQLKRKAKILKVQSDHNIPTGDIKLWNDIKKARPDVVTTRTNGDEVIQLDTDVAIIKTKDDKFVLEAIGHRIDDSADAVVTKEPTPVKPKKDKWARITEHEFWSMGQSSLVKGILELHKKGLVDDLQAMYGLRLLIDAHKTEDGLKIYIAWWAGLMEGTPENSTQRLWSPESAHRKLLSNMRQMKEEGVEFDNVILETLKEAELVQNNRGMFKDVFDYVKPEKAEAPPKVDPVDEPAPLTQTVRSELFDEPSEAVRLWEEPNSFERLMGEDMELVAELGDAGRQWFRQVEIEFASDKNVKADLVAVESMLKKLTTVADANGEGNYLIAFDYLYRIMPEGYSHMVDNLFGHLKGTKMVHILDVWETLMERMALFDPDRAASWELRVMGELAGVESSTPLGYYKNTALNRETFGNRLIEAHERAMDKNGRIEVTPRGTFLEQIIDGLEDAMSHSGNQGRVGIRRRMVEELGPEVFQGDGQPLKIIKAWEEKVLSTVAERPDIHVFADGTHGQLENGSDIGWAIINYFNGREGHSRQVIAQDVTYVGGKPTISSNLGRITMGNRAAPLTTARIAELVDDLAGHTRRNHILKVDAEGNRVKTTDEDIAALEQWFKDINAGKIQQMSLSHWGGVLRMTPQNAISSPREKIPSLGGRIKQAYENMVLLPPGQITAVHDGFTFHLGHIMGLGPEGANIHPPATGEAAGLFSGMPTMLAHPYSWADAYNRFWEMFAPTESGFAARARKEYIELNYESEAMALKDPKLNARVLKELLEDHPKIGQMKAVDADTVAKELSKSGREGYEKVVYTENWNTRGHKDQWTSTQRTGVKKIQAHRAETIRGLNERGNEVDATASGIQITLLHQRLNRNWMENNKVGNPDNPNQSYAEHFAEWGERNAPDMYRITHEYIRGEMKNMDLTDQPFAKWWWDNIFNTSISATAAKGDSLDGYGNILSATVIRELMKLPVMTPMYDAGFPALRKNLLDFFVNKNSDDYIGNTIIDVDGVKVPLADHFKNENIDIEANVSWLAKRLLKGQDAHHRGWVRDALGLESGDKLTNLLFGHLNKFTVEGKDYDLGNLTLDQIMRISQGYANTIGVDGDRMPHTNMAYILLRAKVMEQNSPQWMKGRDFVQAAKDEVLPLLYAKDKTALTNAIESTRANSMLVQGMNHLMRTGIKLDPTLYRKMIDDLGLNEVDAPWVVSRNGKKVQLLDSDVRADHRLLMSTPMYFQMTRSMEGRLFHHFQGTGYQRINDITEHPYGGYVMNNDPLFGHGLSKAEIQAQVKERVILQTALEAAEHWEPPTLRNQEYSDPTMEESISYSQSRTQAHQKRLLDITKRMEENEQVKERYNAEIEKGEKADPDVVAELGRQLAFNKLYKALPFTPILERMEGYSTKEGGETYHPSYRTLEGPEGTLPRILQHGVDEVVGIPLIRKLINNRNPVVMRRKKLKELRERASHVHFNQSVFSLRDRTSVSSREIDDVTPVASAAHMYNGIIRDGTGLDIDVETRTALLHSEITDFKKILKMDNKDILTAAKGLFPWKFDAGKVKKMSPSLEYLTLWVLHNRSQWNDGFSQAVRPLYIDPRTSDFSALDLSVVVSRENRRWGLMGAQYGDDAVNRITSSTSLGTRDGAVDVMAGSSYENVIRRMTQPQVWDPRVGWLFSDQIQTNRVIAIGSVANRGIDTKAKSGLKARLMQTEDSTILIGSTAVFDEVIKSVFVAKRGPLDQFDNPGEEMRQFVNFEMYEPAGMGSDAFRRTLAKEVGKKLEGEEGIIKSGLDIFIYIDPADKIDPRAARMLGLESNTGDELSFKDIQALMGNKGVGSPSRPIPIWVNAFGEDAGPHKLKGNVRVGLTFYDKLRGLHTAENITAVETMRLVSVLNLESIRIGETQATAVGSREGTVGLGGRSMAENRAMHALEVKALARLAGKNIDGLLVEDRNIGNIKFAGDRKPSVPIFFKWFSDELGQGVDVGVADKVLVRHKMNRLLVSLRKVTQQKTLENPEWAGKAEVQEDMIWLQALASRPLSEIDDNSLLGMRMAWLGLDTETHYKALNPLDIDGEMRKIDTDTPEAAAMAKAEVIKKWENNRGEAMDTAHKVTQIFNWWSRHFEETTVDASIKHAKSLLSQGIGLDEITLRAWVLDNYSISDVKADAIVHKAWTRGQLDREVADPWTETDIATAKNDAVKKATDALKKSEDESDNFETRKAEGPRAILAELNKKVRRSGGVARSDTDAEGGRGKWSGVTTATALKPFKGDASTDRAKEIGTVADEIVRDFFREPDGSGLKPWNNYRSKETHNHIFVDERSFNKFIDDELTPLRDWFETREETVFAEGIFVRSEKEFLRGELDIVTIDPQNKIRIYDLKTRKAGSEGFDNMKPDNSETYRAGWERQLSLYAALLKNEHGLDIDSIHIIPLRNTQGAELTKNVGIHQTDGLGFDKTTDGLPLYAKEITRLDEIELVGLGKKRGKARVIKYADGKIFRDVPRIYKGWDHSAGQKYGIFYTSGSAVPRWNERLISGDAFDSGEVFRSRNIFEIIPPEKIVESPDEANGFLGRAHEVTVVRQVDADEVDANKFYIYDNRSTYDEGTIIHADDVRGVRDNIVSANREQKALVEGTRNYVHSTESDLGGKKTMEYYGKSKNFKQMGTKNHRVDNLIEQLVEKNAEGVRYLSKREANILRQVLYGWEGADTLHDVMFRVSDDVDSSGKFIGEYDPTAARWKRSIELLRQARENEGFSLGYLDILLHEVGHVSQHKAALNKHSEDYALLRKAYDDEGGREDLSKLLDIVYGEEQGKKMYDNIYNRPEGEYEIALDELFAQVFSAVMLASAAKNSEISKGLSKLAYGQNVRGILSILSDHAIPEFERISAIMSKIREGDTAMSQLVKYIYRSHYYAPAVERMQTSFDPIVRYHQVDNRSGASAWLKTTIEKNESEIDGLLESDPKLADPNNKITHERLVTTNQKLQAQLTEVGSSFASPRAIALWKDLLVTEDGLLDLSPVKTLGDVSHLLMADVVRKQMYDHMGNPENTTLSETLGIINEGLGRKSKQALSMLSSPFTHRNRIESSSMDVIRFLANLVDDQAVITGAMYGTRQGIPSLQSLSVDWHGEMESIPELLVGQNGYLKKNKRYRNNRVKATELVENITRYLNTPEARQRDFLEAIFDSRDYDIVITVAEHFKKMHLETIDNAVVSRKLAGANSEAVGKTLSEEYSVPIRLREEYFTEKDSASKDFSSFISKRMIENEYLDYDSVLLTNNGSQPLFPNPRMIQARDIPALEQVWEAYSPATKKKILDAYHVQNTGESRVDIFSWMNVHITKGAKKEELFGDIEINQYHKAIDNKDAVNFSNQKYLFEKVRESRKVQDKHSFNRFTNRNLEKHVVSASEFAWIKFAHQTGSSAYMFMGNRMMTPKDIFGDPSINKWVEHDIMQITEGLQKGIGWDAYTTRFIQDYFGIRGMGFKEVIDTVRTMLKSEELMFTNKDGTVSPRRFDEKELAKIKKVLETLDLRYEAIGRRGRGPADDGDTANMFLKMANGAITLGVSPHFVVAQNIEMGVALGRRFGRMLFGDFGDSFWQGLLGSMSPIKRKKYLHGLGIASQNVRGRSNRLMDVAYQGWGDEAAKATGKSTKTRLEGVYDWMKDAALLGFNTYTLYTKSTEILPAQSRLVNDIEKLYKLRELIKQHEGIEMTKNRWRAVVKESKLGSRFDEADEYQKLGFLQDGVLEQIQTWIRDTQWQENIFDWSAFRDDMHTTIDGNMYRIKAKAIQAMKSHSWNAATKTSFERRGQEVPTITQQGSLQALMYKLTSFPQMFFRFNSRLMATRTLAQILPLWIMYASGESLYARILDLARGRTPSEIEHEWREDPVGASMLAAAKLPFLGWSTYMGSSILELIRTWAGKEFNNAGPFGYKEGYSPSQIVGQIGGTSAINTIIRSWGEILGGITAMASGDDFSTKQIMRMTKTMPLPFRPIIMASIGYAMAEEEMSKRSPNYRVPNSNRFTNGLLKGVGTDTGRRLQRERVQVMEENRRKRKLEESIERKRLERIRVERDGHPLEKLPGIIEAPDSLLEID